MAAAYETLSCEVRCFSTGTGAAVLGVAAAALATFVSRALLSLVLVAVSRPGNARRVVSVLAEAVCGDEDVDTGGAPLLTDSGPQAPSEVNAISAAARRAKIRDDVVGIMTEADLCVHGMREARHSVARASRPER
jgi:hypothetical protein